MGLRNGPILAGMVAVLGVATAALALAPPNDAITADTTQLSIGTEFTVDGEGFGEKKPNVWLIAQGNGKKAKGPKKHPLKVLDYSDTQLTLLYKKPAAAGSYTLQIQPKKSDVLTDTLAVSIENPMPMSLSTDTADPKQEVTITGEFFGTKKGKVYVGDLNAKGSPGKTKVKSWTDTSITFQAPKKQPNGTYAVNVINKAGVGQMAGALTIQNSNVGVKPISSKNKFTAKVGKIGFNATKLTVNAGYVPPFLSLNGQYIKVGIGKGTIRSFRVTLGVGDLENATFPLQVQSSQADFADKTFKGLDPGGDGKVWATDDGITATIHNFANGRVSVTLSGTLDPNSGGATGTVNVSNGTFTGPVNNGQ